MTLTPSHNFIDTLRFGAYLIAGHLTIYSGGQATDIYVPLSVGQLTIDRAATQRRVCTITAELEPTIPPDPLMPVSPSSLLAPFDASVYHEVNVETAIMPTEVVSPNPSGGPPLLTQQTQPYYTSMGRFPLISSTVDDTNLDLTTTLSLYDRSFIISQRQFYANYNLPQAGGNFAAEIQALVNYVWTTNQKTGAQIPSMPALTYNIVPTTAVVPTGTSFNQGSDPWQAVQDLAQAIGYEVFFDASGTLIGKPIPDPLAQPVVWYFTDDPTLIYGSAGTGSAGLLGSVYSTPAEVQVDFTRDGVYNDIVVTGTGTQNTAGGSGSSSPILAEAIDQNPMSPTYINGPLGCVPDFMSSNMVLTQPQAQQTANAELQVARFSAWQVTLSCAPNPLFDVDQVVEITRPRVGLQGTKMVIDRVDHIMHYGDLMKIQGRVLPPAGA
jgi:hypothetical protein